MSITGRLLRAYDVSRQRLLRRSLPPMTPTEIDLARDFGQKMQRVVSKIDPSMPASEQAWQRNMMRLKELASGRDPREFLSWDVISGTMFVRYAKYSRAEYRYLRHLPDWLRWRKGIAESRIGNPPPCPFDTTTSCNLIHHAYHIARFEQAMSVQVDGYKFVIEFGGGYGSLCRLMYQLGFVGQYIIIDLPAFSLLQEYFLKSVGITVLTEEEFLAGKPGVLCLSDLGSLEKFTSDKQKSLMVATWSLSESPLSVRSAVMGVVRSFDGFLFAFQPEFEGIDNVKYFDEWKKTMGDYEWKLQEMEHQPRQRYLFGRLRSSQV